ncbi:MAG: nucleoside monophosphate kinase [Alphaproteobacteria bacterium]|nr:nucleoside monophosphate kinase [Alphaproteobacteria bacterium]
MENRVTCFNGPMGSGKTAIPKLIQLLCPMPIKIIGVGDMLRAAQVDGRLDQARTKKMNDGYLLDSEFIWNFIKPNLPIDKSFFIDGFPRRSNQVPMILKWCQENKFSMLYFNITQSHEITERRLSERSAERNRNDNKPKTRGVRWKEYEKHTQNVANELNKQIHNFPIPLEIIEFDSNQIIDYPSLFKYTKVRTN